MNKTEAVLFCRYVKAMCPAQVLDEYTPDAWADVLDEVTLEDAKQTVQDGIRWGGWHFVDVAEVIAGTAHRRAGRVDDYRRRHGALIAPDHFGDDVRAEHEWLLAATERIRNGEVTEPHELGTHGVVDLPKSSQRSKQANPTPVDREELRKALTTHPRPVAPAPQEVAR